MTLQEAGLEKEEIEDVILVGGMTRMPRVQASVSEFFERPPPEASSRRSAPSGR
ncbi:MAG: Hsp70 family protein [Myxococcota bacterium]